MENSYLKLFQNNKEWVADQIKRDPNYFKDLANGQTPEYL